MTEQEEQALHLILTKYYVERKGWTIQHHPVNHSKFFDEDGMCTGFVPDLTNRDFLWELVEMLNVHKIIVFLSKNPRCVVNWGAIKVEATAKTIELALAICLGKIIKEKK